MCHLPAGMTVSIRVFMHQRVLAADNGMSEAVIATSVSVGESTVYRTKRRFVEGNLELALSEEPRPHCGRKR